MAKKHEKHAKLSRPNLGHFGRNELAILGTPCGEIKNLAGQISSALGTNYHIAYVDADHKSGDDPSNLSGSMLAVGNQVEYTDKIDFHRWDEISCPTPFEIKKRFTDQDLVLINGNHFEGKHQIVIIDSRKSLEKKLHKLTDVILILFQDEATDLPDYLTAHLGAVDQIPKYAISDTEAIVSFIKNRLTDALPPIKGLVLAGGRSTRMQKDKSEIKYFGKSQKAHMFDILSNLTQKAYYAVREDQWTDAENQIADTFIGLGPYGAILSAFRTDPDVAWLVTACDQPFLDQKTLELLLMKRNPSKLATAFYNPETDFPEPLITLWEPRAYPQLLHFLSLGYSCPRKVLINSDIELIQAKDAQVLKNVNTPEEYEEALKLLH